MQHRFTSEKMVRFLNKSICIALCIDEKQRNGVQNNLLLKTSYLYSRNCEIYSETSYLYSRNCEGYSENTEIYIVAESRDISENHTSTVRKNDLLYLLP